MNTTLREMAMKGLHAFVIDNLVSSVSKNKNVLILGSGQGAFEERLLALGFTNITAVDFYTEYQLSDRVKFLKIDLTMPDFASEILQAGMGTFDLIIAVEVIEHLESTAGFLRNAKELLEKDGNLIISTPNTRSPLARIDALITGYPTYYVATPNEPGGHINPIFDNIFRFLAEENELTIQDELQFGSAWKYTTLYTKTGFRSWCYLGLLLSLLIVLRPLMLLGSKNMGLVSIYQLRRK